MTDTLIHFVCRAPSHRRVEEGRTVTEAGVKIHQMEWAYCPANESTGHDWLAIRPVNLNELKGQLAGTIR